ncbi:MAG: hypothetical protein ACOYOV_11175 [Bacteroidales bacterium]
MNIQDKDPFLAKLLRQLPLDEPSEDFTQRLMSIIQQTEVEDVEKASFFLVYRYWLIAAFTVCMLVATTIFFPSFIGHRQIQTLQNFFNPFVNAFNSIASLLKTQPIISVVILSLVGLLMIDRLLSKMFHQNVQHS